MDTSRLFTVEFSPRQQDWRIDALDQVLKANYQSFLGGGGRRGGAIVVGKDEAIVDINRKGGASLIRRAGVAFVDESDDWMLLGVCSSQEEAKALASRFQEIRNRFERELQEARDSYIDQFPGSEEDSAQK